MKKPFMLIPPAQAEALYDAALEELPRGRPSMSAFLERWAEDWAEDDLALPQPGQTVSKAQDRHSSSKSSR